MLIRNAADANRTVGSAPAAHVLGAPDGVGLSNADTLLPKLYRKLGYDRLPSVMVIFAEPFLKRKTHGVNIDVNPFGHAAVAYQYKGHMRVMNIVGCGDPAMVNFLPLEDYLFGTKDFYNGAEQGGIYNRTMRIAAIWDCPPDTGVKLNTYYKQLRKQELNNQAKFSTLCPYVKNISPWRDKSVVYGNCALWSSRGLKHAGLMPHTTMWPKNMITHFLKRSETRRVSLISLPRVPHAQLSRGCKTYHHSLVSPLRWTSNWRFWNLDRRSAAEVFVPPGSLRGKVVGQREPGL